ncbi:MAG: SIR2 family protein [Trichodesmium sp.]
MLKNEIDLAQLIATHPIGDCPYTLFLGAGASVSSGIPSANGMVREWQKSLYKSIKKPKYIAEENFENWLSSGEYKSWREQKATDYNQSDYSLLFTYRYHQPLERKNYIEKLLEGKKPAFGYLYLASLIASKRLNRILTVNFDDLIAEALLKFYGIKPIVCAFNSTISETYISKQKPKVIKLHGDFLYDDIRKLDDSFNSGRTQSSFQRNIEKKMKEMTRGYGLIVTGYSGNDKSIMSTISDLLKNQYLTYGLHWCLHKPRKSDKELEIPAKLLELKDNYPNKVHLYEIESFDKLMEEIHLECRSELPKVLSQPHPNNLVVEFYESVRGGSSEILSDQMKEYLYKFVESLDKINTNEYSIIKAELKWELGASQRRQGYEEVALQFFVDGYALLEEAIKQNLPLELKIKALRRKSGLCTSIAKFIEKGFEIPNSSDGVTLPFFEWQEALEEAFKVIDEGFELCQQPETEKIPAPFKRTFSFNGCCAYSLKAKWQSKDSGGNHSDAVEEIAQKVIPFIRYIKSLDLEREHIYKLVKDPDFHYLYENSQVVKSEINEV